MAKRFLLISSNSSGRGGGERYLVYLARGLRAIGFEVHALLSQASYMDLWGQDLAKEGVVVHREKLVGLRDRPLRFVQSMLDFRQQRRIAESCIRIQPDAILVNQQYDEDGLDFVGGALRANVAPVGGTIHMPMTATKNQRPLGRLRGYWVQRWLSTHPYQMIVVSSGACRELESYYRCPRRPRIVRYGCPIDDLPEGLPSLPDGWDDSIPTMGFTGQFVGQKNLELLVEAWLLLVKEETKCRLLLVGDGPEREKLEAKLQMAPSSLWHITGWQDQPERFLQAMDLYAMTSHFEGLPLALIEAAGRGVPAVVTNFNGASDVAEKAEWVHVVNDATPQEMAAAFRKALATLSDQRQQAIDEADRFQEYFSVERMATETAEALGVVPFSSPIDRR